MKIFSIVLTAIATFCLLVNGTAVAKELRLGGVHSPSSFETKGLTLFADLVEEKTKGTLTVSVFPSGQLGDAVSMIENVMMGAQDMFANVSDWNQHLNKDFKVLSMPFAFKDTDHMKRFQGSSTYKAMQETMLKEKKIRVLADNWYRMPRVLVTKDEVKSLADIKDRKLRMANLPTYIETWKALGAKPTVIPWAEAYLSVRTGITVGLDSPLSSVYSQKFYQVAPWVTLTYHVVAPFNILISEVVFSKLPIDQQKALLEAAQEAGVAYTKSIDDNFAPQKQEMEKAGTKFVTIDTAPFAKIAGEVAARFETEGMWSQGLFAEIRSY
jgi:tripartite ATP-independent transporter DctP family solute receptor